VGVHACVAAPVRLPFVRALSPLSTHAGTTYTAHTQAPRILHTRRHHVYCTRAGTTYTEASPRAVVCTSLPFPPLCSLHMLLILNVLLSCSMRSTAAPYHGSTACIAWQVMRHFTACPGGGHAPGGHAPRREICSSTPPSCPHHPRTYVHTRACMHTFISCEHVLSCKHMHRSGLFCAQAAHLCCSGLSRIVQHGLELWLRGVSRGLDMRSAETGRGN